jgi:hypothetical protein
MVTVCLRLSGVSLVAGAFALCYKDPHQDADVFIFTTQVTFSQVENRRSRIRIIIADKEIRL